MSDGDLNDIYNSRTFCLYEDIDFIKSQGLAKGGSLENAVVVKDNEILNDEGLRNRHEFVFHKIFRLPWRSYVVWPQNIWSRKKLPKVVMR